MSSTTPGGSLTASSGGSSSLPIGRPGQAKAAMKSGGGSVPLASPINHHRSVLGPAPPSACWGRTGISNSNSVPPPNRDARQGFAAPAAVRMTSPQRWVPSQPHHQVPQMIRKDSSGIDNSQGDSLSVDSMSDSGQAVPSWQSTRGSSDGGGIYAASPRFSVASQMDNKDIRTLQSTFDTSMKALKQAPSLEAPQSKSQLDLAGALNAVTAALQMEAGTKDGSDKHLAMASLRQTLEEQQALQQEQIAILAKQWEDRFAALEQAVTHGLKLTTSTAIAMNERSAKFLRFGEVMEGALDKIVSEGRDISALSQSAAKAQWGVDHLAKELAEERADRRKIVAEVLGQVEQCRAEFRSGHISGGGGGAASGAAPAFADPEMAWNELNRVSRELKEEVSERRQLVRDIQLAKQDATEFSQRLAATQDRVERMSRELETTSQDVHKVAGEVARVWSSEVCSRLDLGPRSLSNSVPSSPGVATTPDLRAEFLGGFRRPAQKRGEFRPGDSASSSDALPNGGAGAAMLRGWESGSPGASKGPSEVPSPGSTSSVGSGLSGSLRAAYKASLGVSVIADGHGTSSDTQKDIVSEIEASAKRATEMIRRGQSSAKRGVGSQVPRRNVPTSIPEEESSPTRLISQ